MSRAFRGCRHELPAGGAHARASPGQRSPVTLPARLCAGVSGGAPQAESRPPRRTGFSPDGGAVWCRSHQLWSCLSRGQRTLEGLCERWQCVVGTASTGRTPSTDASFEQPLSGQSPEGSLSLSSFRMWCTKHHSLPCSETPFTERERSLRTVLAHCWRTSPGQPCAAAWGPLRLRLTARSPGWAGLGLFAAQSPEQNEQATQCPSASATFAISEHTHPSPSHPISAPSTRRLAPTSTSQSRDRGPRASPRRAS